MESKQDFDDTAPFREPLEDTVIFSERLKKLRSSPDKLVKEWPLYSRRERKEKDFEVELNKRTVEFKRGMAVFHELEERYGIAIPKIDLIVGEEVSDGRIQMFSVVDKIQGQDLMRASGLPNSAKDKFDQFFSVMTQHSIDTYREGGDCWDDLIPEQIMYGHKTGGEEDKIYIVDTDPRYYAFGKGGPDIDILYKCLKSVTDCIETAESKFANFVVLEKARENLVKIIDFVSKDHSDNDSDFMDLKAQAEKYSNQAPAKAA
ncbi:MAG: hypothetical protein Q7S12_04085 [bacterium]|nr:hypothetical protein [bacterium]